MGKSWLIGVAILASAAGSLDAAAQPCNGSLGDPLWDLHASLYSIPDGLSPKGERVYQDFVLSLEPQDATWDGQQLWVTNEEKVGDLLLNMPLGDVSPWLQERVGAGLSKIGASLSDDASLSDVPDDIGDMLDERFEDAVGETTADAIRLGAGIAWGLTQGGKVRLYQNEWNRRNRLRLYYDYDPRGDDSLELRYRYKPSDYARFDFTARRDRVGIEYVVERHRMLYRLSASWNEDSGAQALFVFHVPLGSR